jgi:N-acetylmuramoyl-L-alanine amidase
MMYRWRAVAILLAIPPAGLVAQAQPAQVEADVGGRRAALAVSAHLTYAAVNGSELASVFEAGGVSGPFLRARIGSRALVLEAGSPFFQFGDQSFQLANAPYLWGGTLWVPAEFVTGWLPVHAGQTRTVAGVVADETARRVDPNHSWHVVIDPGHGGRDPGTSGDRAREKDIVLAISRVLRDELASMDRIDASLTRDRDIYVPHDERSAFAVDREGDLFVSIHANSVPSASSARGFETYFLGPARSEEAREVALRENRTPDVGDSSAGSIDDRRFILTGLDRTENISESRRFAGFVQNALREARGPGVPDRGVKQGPWWVLLGALARMPSVIIEVGFVSNPREEAYLVSQDGQREVAGAIARAIVAYREDVIRRFAATEGAGN